MQSKSRAVDQIISSLRQAKFNEHTLKRRVVAGLVSTLLADASLASNTSINFDIPAQEASSALIAFSEQANISVLVKHSARSVNVPELRGRYSIQEAITKLLKNTDLTYKLRGNSIIVSPRSSKGTRTSLYAVISATMMSIFTPSMVSAQETKEGSIVLEEVIVTGSRAANRAAIAVKNEHHQIMDALSADDVGALPDINIADAFRRMPGVNTQFASDEGRTVTVRGIAPDLNLVTIDGMSLGSSDENSSATNMEAIPAGAVAGLEVFKAMTPDLDANAIGGILNMVTRSAFSKGDRFLQFKAQASKYSFDDIPGDNKLGANLGIAYSDTFGADDQFGIVLSASYNKKDRDGHDTLTKVSYIPQDGNEYFVFSNNSYTRSTVNTWERKSYSAKFEYQPNDTIYAFLNNYYYSLEEDEITYLHRVESTAKSEDIVINSATSATTPTGKSSNDVSYSGNETSTLGNHFHIEYRIGDMQQIDFDVARVSSQTRLPSQQLIFRSDSSEALGYTVDSGSFTPKVSVNDPSYFADATNFEMFSFQEKLLKTLDEDLTEIKVDYSYNSDTGALGWGAIAGLKFRRTDREFDKDAVKYGAWDGAGDLTMEDFVTGEASYTPFIPAYPSLLLSLDKFQTFFDANRDQFKFSDKDNKKTALDRDYELREDVSAVYLGTQFASDSLTVIGGVRYEKTKLNTEGILHDKDENTFEPASNGASYDDVLPSISATYRFTDSLILRAALSKSMGRPNPGDVKARESIDVNDGKSEIKRSLGNPDLEPRRSINYDLSLEYYFDQGDSLLSVAVYRKDIENLIFNPILEELDPETGYTIITTQKRNAEDAEGTGIELSMIKNTFDFDILPEFFHNFGVSANATFIDAEMTYKNVDGESVTVDHMVSQPDFLANVSVFYNIMDRGEIRLAYNYTDSYSGALKLNGKEKDEHIWQAFEQVDLQARFDITDNLKVNAKVRNIGNQLREQSTYFDTRSYYRRDFGRSFWLGMSYIF
jgi:iron complex outermembrane recepter protein